MSKKSFTRNFYGSGFYHDSKYTFRTETITIENSIFKSVEFKQWGDEQYKKRKFYPEDEEFGMVLIKCLRWLYVDNFDEFCIMKKMFEIYNQEMLEFLNNIVI